VEKPDVPWEQIGADMITGLPVTDKGHDAILLFVDHTTKMVHLIPTTKEMDAVEFAQHFVKEVCRPHGLPRLICSDRGSVFVSKFTTELINLLGTHQALSTAFHPQSGGQHERMNRVLEEMLRHYVEPDHSDWDKHLWIAEFAMNNAVSTTTGFTPFQLNQGWQPRTPLGEGIMRPDLKVPAAHALVQNWQERLRHAKAAMRVAQDRQKAFADSKRRDVDPLKVGDQVLLSTKNIRLKRGTGVLKLLPRWIGPFPVTEVVSALAYRLELPESLKIHPVFHVSLLKPYRPSERRQPPPPPLLLTDEDDDIYEVQAIIDDRQVSRRGGTKKTQYLVVWKGYGPEHNSWEPDENLENARSAIKKYLRTKARKRALPP
jgi:Chromo (CHRromatin Organisation MOdifier) domain/Integrase core domain